MGDSLNKYVINSLVILSKIGKFYIFFIFIHFFCPLAPPCSGCVTQPAISMLRRGTRDGALTAAAARGRAESIVYDADADGALIASTRRGGVGLQGPQCTVTTLLPQTPI